MAPGDYVYHFRVALNDHYGASTGDLSQFFDVTFTLVDPCDPPQSIQSHALEDQKYIITDSPLIYEFATSAEIVPSFCPYEAELSVTAFEDCKGQASNAVAVVASGELKNTI